MMAVSSLQYTMGISSGFKVYILEGQHSARNTDRYRPLTSHGIPIYPIKRKLSPDPPQPPKKLCASSHQSRQKSSHSPAKMKCAARQPPAAAASLKVPAAHLDLKSVLRRLLPDPRISERKETEEEQPLALVKRLEKPVEPPVVSPAVLQQVGCIEGSTEVIGHPTAYLPTSEQQKEGQLHGSPFFFFYMTCCDPEFHNGIPQGPP
ncbi:hypothetical protein GDO78_015185 [Eleutherodactylus coqui]|uniref:Uncharacterized protein n=1 Tax=Eleutherodactylus coqui TaxID=57060 RepID=A0A8J6BEA8_ELECQ|nr:hypothetical protein GDO78_015185 [Eleutherodactylus coqui]